ncbi:MAG TPA: SUMF1/EgtB/PvdO family nonheme iron enzyme, partial [Nitrospirota bacterium]
MENRNYVLWAVAILAVGMLSIAAGPSTESKDGQAASFQTIKGKDGAPMVLIPAGPFTMGSNDGLPNERPEHTVTLEPYYIDQYEV